MEKFVKSLSFAIGAALLVSFCGSSAMAGLQSINKVRYRPIVNRKTRSRKAQYICNFVVKDGINDFRLPFELGGKPGRYKLEATWKPSTKISLNLLVPSGGRALLTKRFGNRPGKKYIELKERNFSKANNGKLAAFSIKNNTGVKVSGSILLIEAPRSARDERVHTIEERQNVQAEKQRERNIHLKNRVVALEKAVEKLTARVRSLELKSKARAKPVRTKRIK